MRTSWSEELNLEGRSPALQPHQHVTTPDCRKAGAVGPFSRQAHHAFCRKRRCIHQRQTLTSFPHRWESIALPIGIQHALDERDESVGALFMACYPWDGFGAMTPAPASDSSNRHVEPKHRDTGKRSISNQAVSGVVDLGAGLAAFGANRRLGGLKFQGETLSSAGEGDDGVARKKDLIEVAGGECLLKQGYRKSLA